MSTFSLLISPPDALQPGFTESLACPLPLFALPLRCLSALVPHPKTKTHETVSQNAPLPRALLHIPSFGSWLEPRYIFAAGQLI